MTAREFERLIRKYLLPQLPDFVCRGSLLYTRPIADLLRGISFDSYRFLPRSFDVRPFVQPLYVPIEHIHYGFATRLTGRSGDYWDLAQGDEVQTMEDVLASIRIQGLPFLASRRSPADLVERLPLLHGGTDNPHTAEAFAYSCVLVGDMPAALRTIDHIRPVLERERELSPWMDEILSRTQTVKEYLERDPKQALALLAEWKEYTRSKLRLPKEE